MQLLQELLECNGAAAAVARELTLGLTWNITARDIALEASLILMGGAHTVVRTIHPPAFQNVNG